MLKVHTLLLTLALPFFTLFLFESEANFALKKVTHPHDIKIDHTFNALAISINNSFDELLNFDYQKNPSRQNHAYTKSVLSTIFVEKELHYLKVCNFIDLELSPQNIIYPFHSFL